MSGPVTVTGPEPTEQALFTVLRQALLPYMPTGVEMLRGQVNRVPEPKRGDFVVFWPIMRTPLAVPIQTYRDDVPTGGVITATSLLEPAEITIQMDVHGPASAAIVTTLGILARSGVLFDDIAAVTDDIAVLYADGPRQVPFDNAESQYEWRWTLDLHVQVNSTITLPQQFADKLTATVTRADATP